MSGLSRNELIVGAYLNGELQTVIAKQHGITQARVSAIIRSAGQQGNWRARIGESLHRYHLARISEQFSTPPDHPRARLAHRDVSARGVGPFHAATANTDEALQS